jgi:hypothetical protein
MKEQNLSQKLSKLIQLSPISIFVNINYLTCFIIDNSQIGSDGAESIAEALQKNTGLIKLNIGYIAISIYLGSNKIQEKGALSLKSATCSKSNLYLST